jgi:NADPH:quinone reductase-like Zn-dependent oxidoreductase
MSYRSVVVTKRGGPEGLQVVQKDLLPPPAGEARVRMLVTPVCQDDVAARVGNRPFLPKLPFVPGYAMIGTVDATGEGVTRVAAGDRVSALTNYGSHAEYIDILAEDWAALFRLLEEGKIKPIIAETFPLLEASKANALLESGQVTGNIVLLAPGQP